MKLIISTLAFCLCASVPLLAQTANVQKKIADNTLTGPVVVPSGGSITINAGGTITNNGTATGFGGTWGSITGTLSGQTDLQSALDLKAPVASPTFTGTATSQNLVLTGNIGTGYIQINPQNSSPGVFGSTGRFYFDTVLGPRFVSPLTGDATFILSSDSGTVTNTMLAGSIANAKLANSAITIAGTSTALGGSITFDAMVPSQTSNSGKFLTTNGTTTSWGTVSTGITIDTTAITGGTIGNILFHKTGNVVGEMTTTGSGTVVALATSPSFTTPALGTPTAGVLTNCTGLPAASVVAGTFGTGAFTHTGSAGSSALTITGATQTSSFPALAITQTWNASGTTFTGLSYTVTNTASAAGSKIADFIFGSTSMFTIYGGTTTNAGIGIAGAGRFVDAQWWGFGSGTIMHFTNAAGTAPGVFGCRGINLGEGTATRRGYFDAYDGEVHLNATGFLHLEGNVTFDKTVTAGGTTGAQTINKNSGQVNFAAGASTLVVTNSLVTTSSIVIVQVLGTDATALTARVTKASGSFTITLNAAATAETAVSFLITN